MTHSLPTRALPERPDLNQLKRQAKDLLKSFLASDESAITEVNRHYRNADPSMFALHDAQLVLACAYGFTSWPRLKAFVDGVTVRRLADAVRSGDLAQARKMLELRPELINMDMAENDEHHALHYAVFARSPEMVRLLMQFGADAHTGIYPHRKATTAFTIAAERGYDEIVSIIFEEEDRRREEEYRRRSELGGPNMAVNAAVDDLTQTIARGDEDAAIAILESEPALSHACDRNGWTPLHAAAGVRNRRLVEWLLDHGADVNRRGPGDRTPFDSAAARRWTAPDPEGLAPVAEVLRRRGAHLTARSAVALGDKSWLAARHAEGVLANPIEDWGGLLTLAVLYDRPEILELFLDFGFDPDERIRLEGLDEVVYSQGMPLWNCAATGKLAMAQMLLEHGADPNKHVYAAGAPVHSAYHHQDWAMLELLERYGGVVPPVTLALCGAKEAARQMLVEEAEGRVPAGILEGRNVSEDLLRGAADSGDADIVRMALPGVDWARDDDRWYWILMQAVWAPSPDCFGLLIERCDPNLRHPRFGRTILHDIAALGGAATAEQSPALAAIALDAGARIDQRDDILKSTPLGWACRWGRIQLVEFLLERGADPVEADAEFWAMPEAWAHKMGHDDVLALLQRYRR